MFASAFHSHARAYETFSKLAANLPLNGRICDDLYAADFVNVL
jgi:hypothetical protein